MGDLIELDQGRAYGAGRAFIREAELGQMEGMELGEDDNAVF